MTIAEISEKLGAPVETGKENLSNKVTGCYIGDLLSLAMAKVEEGTVWITIQTNINVVAVASLQDAAAVIIADGFSPDENMKAKAGENGIPVLKSDLPAYEIAKKLAEIGV